MKTIKIKRNSWHAWVARHGAEYDIAEAYNPDRCTYVRKVLKGLFFLVFMAVIASLAVAAIGNTVWWWISMILAGGYINPSSPVPISITGAGSIILAVALIMVGADKIKEARREAQYRRWRESGEEQPEGFLAMAWKSFKEKTCARIEVAD